MSRAAAASDVITVKPTSNVYTVLVISAVVVEIVGLVAIIMRYKALFPNVTDMPYIFF